MNNRRKNFMQIIKYSAILFGCALMFVFAGISRQSAALLIGAGSIAILALASVITFGVLVSRMNKDSKDKWQSYLSLEENKNIDYQQQLEQVRLNFANDTNGNKNRIPKLDVSGIRPFYDYSVLERGKVYYGCLVQANDKLFWQPLSLNEVLPAVLIYSTDEYYEQHPDELAPIAKALFADKENNILSKETSYFSNIEVPSETIVGGHVYMTTVMVYRENLPMGRLIDWNIMPIIAQPNECSSVFILDSKYWTQDLIFKYTHSDMHNEPNSDAYVFSENGEPTAMRKLTVTRKKSFVECASRIYLLIPCEKTQATEFRNHVPYKRILLKNGKTITVDIPCEQTDISIVSSSMQSGYSINSGTDDVALFTEPVFDPSRGNPFVIRKM